VTLSTSSSPSPGRATLVIDPEPGTQIYQPRFDAATMRQHYKELRRRVRAAGLLERSYAFYALFALGIAAGFGLVAYLLAAHPGIGDLLAIPLLTLLMMQIGFLGHDAGHNQIFERTRNNRIAGMICMPFMLGISFETWTSKHNAHHAHTNEVENDPDIDHPLLAFTPEQAAERRGLRRWLVRYQARLYFFLAMGATIGFRYDAWRHLLFDKDARSRKLELTLVIVNTICWLVVPSILLGPGRWLPLFLVQQLLLGVYMASVFAPNHKGMPLIRGEKPSFLEQQVMTSRNVSGGPIVDFLYGGLNFQIEHHLFPNLARKHLPACRDMVRAFCTEIGLPYEEENVIESYRSLLTELEAVGRAEMPHAA